jgi:hypothetical protein
MAICRFHGQLLRTKSILFIIINCHELIDVVFVAESLCFFKLILKNLGHCYQMLQVVFPAPVSHSDERAAFHFLQRTPGVNEQVLLLLSQP